ncbi:MAG TPA: aspartyl protease family protein [Pyrinomonadaceae bacterium]|nr:aspartyl protease family protein [Pyrinomonadaceae bacterium]
MKRGLKATALGLASALTLALLLIVWAASPSRGAALSRLRHFGGRGQSLLAAVLGRRPAPAQGAGLPADVSFRESDSRGLLVKTWVNGSGPYTFAVDTGAGATIISPRVAGEARVEVEAGGRGIEIGGLSGQSVGGGRRAFPRSLSVGFRENLLPGRGLVIVAPGLPSDIDGVLDPVEAYAPHGFVIDMPAGELRAFDPRTNPLRQSATPTGGAVVRWLTDGQSRRPFVMLEEGRRALLDTGSGFGLAVDESAARALGVIASEGRARGYTRDLAGGRIASRRVEAATVHVGPLALRRVPTDLLLRAEKGAPVLLGRDALRPFRLTFDPLSRLIMLDPAE